MIPSIAAAPTVFGFEDDKTASAVCYALSGTALLSSLFTRAEWGAVKLIPYKAHLAIDAVSGVTALAAPWLFGFADNKRARNAFLIMGTIAGIVTALSRPEEMPKYRS